MPDMCGVNEHQWIERVENVWHRGDRYFGLLRYDQPDYTMVTFAVRLCTVCGDVEVLCSCSQSLDCGWVRAEDWVGLGQKVTDPLPCPTS